MLTRYWPLLDVFEKLAWNYPDDAKRYTEILERFLMRLNKNLDQVRERILGMKHCRISVRYFPKKRRKQKKGKVGRYSQFLLLGKTLP